MSVECRDPALIVVQPPSACSDPHIRVDEIVFVAVYLLQEFGISCATTETENTWQ